MDVNVFYWKRVNKLFWINALKRRFKPKLDVQEVANLIDQVKEPGSYGVNFDASQLPSGVYLYRLSSESGITEVRKMLFLK